MHHRIKKLKKYTYVAALVILLAIAGLFWIASHSYAYIVIAPRNATVSVDNKPYVLNNKGIVRIALKGGTHYVKFSADGYAGYTKDYKFRRGFKTTIKMTMSEQPQPAALESGGQLLKYSTNQHSIYYLGNGGSAIYKNEFTIFNNQPAFKSKAITDNKLSGIKEIIWSPKEDLVLFRKSGGDINLFDFQKYDFIHQTETLFGRDIEDIAWAPDNSKIAYVYNPASENTLIFSNFTNTDQERVFDLGQYSITNPLLRWSPDSQYLLLVPRSEDRAANKIYLFNISSRTVTTLVNDEDQLDAAFSPDSKKVIYATHQKDEKNLVQSFVSVINIDGSDKRVLDLRASTKKVVWNDKNLNQLFVDTIDNQTKKEVLFSFDIEKNHQIGYYLSDFGPKYISRYIVLNNGSLIIYETAEGVYYLNLK